MYKANGISRKRINEDCVVTTNGCNSGTCCILFITYRIAIGQVILYATLFLIWWLIIRLLVLTYFYSKWQILYVYFINRFNVSMKSCYFDSILFITVLNSNAGLRRDYSNHVCQLWSGFRTFFTPYLNRLNKLRITHHYQEAVFELS